MKNQIGKMLGRVKSTPRTRTDRLRNLRLESLEGRQLLAADVFSANHNYLIAEDVNQDFVVSPIDALLVINALNSGGSRSFAEGEISSGLSEKLDVNGDNILSPMDALSVINRLNAEGENGEFLITYKYDVTDTSGVPLSSVTVGETFRINVSVQDSRDKPANPDPKLFGVFSAANDIGVSDLDLVTFQTMTNFFSGVDFGPEFVNDLGANEGGGIQIGGDQTPIINDAETFSITVGGTTKTFEFDLNSSSTAGREIITLRNPADSDPVNPLTFTEVSAAMVTAIQGAGLGLTPRSNGQGVVGLPLDQFTLNPGTSSLSISRTDLEYLNEVKGFLDRLSSPNPTGFLPFYSVEFTANAPGVVTFTPNGPERPGSENTLFGERVKIPNEMVMFGSSFNVTIMADETAPVANDDNVTTAEDTPLALNGNITTNDTRNGTRTLTIDSVSAIPNVTLGTVNGTTYTPPANFFGQDRITYVVRDSANLVSNVATVTIQVTPVNDPPDARDDSLTVEEDLAATLLLLADNGNGPDTAGPLEPSDTITITSLAGASGSGTTITTANGATVTIATGGTSVTYTPATGFNGTDTFTYTITDGGGATDTATVTVEVEPGSLPRARTDRASGAENTSVTVDVFANDSVNDGQTPVLKSFTQGSFGTVTQNGNLLVYTPNNENFYGTDTFTYVMNDTADPQLGPDSTATVTITITDVNDVPVLTNDNAATNEDTALTIPVSTLLSNDSPGLGENQGVAQVPQTLSITQVTALTAGGGQVALNGANVVYTPAADFNGQFLFTYVAQDNGSPVLSATATVTVTVAAVNDDPIATNDNVTATEDTPRTIAASSLLANDRPGPATATDEAGQTLTVTAVGTAQNGSVSLAGTNITYTPVANFNGTDTFTYSISDGAGGTATATVTVTVDAVNDAPIAGTDNITAFANTPLTFPSANLLTNDTPGPANESSQTLVVASVAATAATNGTVVLNADGTITYTPNAGYSGPASFTYVVRDSGSNVAPNVNSATGTVNVTVMEFLPSSIAGTVWVDETFYTKRDNQIDAAERRMAGVNITLTGTSLGQSVTRTLKTLADGSYKFDNLGPGQYTVSYQVPVFMVDNPDLPNQQTINITQPGDVHRTDVNFAVVGLSAAPGQASYSTILDQLASNHGSTASGTQFVGAYFALGPDQSLQWTTLLDGYPGVQFAEIAMSNVSDQLLLTVVDTNHLIFTTLLTKNIDYVSTRDSAGNTLVRVLKARSAVEFQQVGLSTPPIVSANKYLDAVRTIFAQQDW